MGAAIRLISCCVILLLTGCGRDTSTPAKALCGHWRNAGTEEYISATEWILKAGSVIVHQPCEIREENLEKFTVTVRTTRDGLVAESVWGFSADRNTLIPVQNAGGKKLQYVDDAESP